MRRPSAYALFFVAIAVGFGANEYLVSRADRLAYYRDTFSTRADLLEQEAKFAKDYVEGTRNLDELSRLLEARVRLKAINFWAIYHDRLPYRTNLGLDELSKMEFALGEGRDVQVREQYSYVARPLRDGFSVVVGLRYSESEVLKGWFGLERGYSVVYLLGILLVAGSAFGFVFRDFADFARRLVDSRRFGGAAPSALSREADLLARGLAAHEERGDGLEKERDLLRRQVLPSLRVEILSGRKPPYDFSCTLVRTDINNFSEIFNTRPNDEFLGLIDGYFLELSRIVARYGGLMHEFVGDEAIYYFKDEEVGNSVAAALSAIREANTAAENVNRMALAEHGYGFTVKSSLAQGRIRYGRFVRGYNLAGSVLIETVRILSQIREREGNVVVYDDRHTEAAGEVSTHAPYRMAELKGFSAPRKLVMYREHKSLEPLLLNPSPALAYYRSPSDLLTILGGAREARDSGDKHRSESLLLALRSCPIPVLSSDLRDGLLAWIEAEKTVHTRGGEAWALAGLTGLIRILVHPSLVTPSLIEYLESAAGDKSDERCASNAVEALAAFDLARAVRVAEAYRGDSSPRLRAVALQVRGMMRLDRPVIAELKRMLDSPEPNSAASAAYAIGEISRYLRAHDLVRFKTNVGFNSLVSRLPSFVAGGEDKLARQAIRAARKSADAKVLQAVRLAAESIADPGRRAMLTAEIDAPVLRPLAWEEDARDRARSA